MVSVLMCIYKEPLEWINDAINSILNQTFSDFEFIIVNDNPDDIELCEFLIQKASSDSRIKIYPNKKNIGLTKSLNIGLGYCLGKYVARMDADDISLQMRFEHQVEYLESSPHCGIVGCWVKSFGYKSEVAKFFQKDEDLKAFQFFHSPFDHPATMMRMSTLVANGISYDESLKYAQDQKLWAQLSKVCEFHNIPEILFLHRFNEQHVSKVHKSEQIKNVKDTRRSMVYDYLAENNILNFNHKEADLNSIISIYKRINSDVMSKADSKKLSRVIMTLLLSIKNPSIGTYIRFISSGIYLNYGWSIKEFIRFFMYHINPAKFPYLGI